MASHHRPAVARMPVGDGGQIPGEVACYGEDGHRAEELPRKPFHAARLSLAAEGFTWSGSRLGLCGSRRDLIHEEGDGHSQRPHKQKCQRKELALPPWSDNGRNNCTKDPPQHRSKEEIPVTCPTRYIALSPPPALPYLGHSMST
jgi:hypothetical protein